MPSSCSIVFSEGNGMTRPPGASGVLISKDWVLSHGSLLKAKLAQDPSFQNFIMTSVTNELTPIKSASSNLQVRVHYSLSNGDPLLLEKDSMKSVEEVNGSIMGLWRCPLLSDAFKNLLFSWHFSDDTRKIYDVPLLSIFLVIRLIQNEDVVNECSLDDALKVLGSLIKDEMSLPSYGRGAAVEIASTPFGNPVFIDSISRGIVSNILGTNGCIMLTDAYTVPRSEGGPVYILHRNTQDRLICGMVIAPLSWCRSEWVDYTFVACLSPCLTRLLNISHQDINRTVQLTDMSELLDDVVVLVRCGAEWGTGILMDRATGTILTCSHVVNEAPTRRIRVVLRSGDIDCEAPASFKWARLIYRTPRGMPYDIAVLQVDSDDIKTSHRHIKIGDGKVQKGEDVISAGFPFLASTLPTFTRGNVSSVSPCMLQTTCCIQSGASGGPIVRPSTGELLGMVVCNVIMSNTLYPRINMAIPASIIKGPVEEFITTGRVEALDTFTSYDDSVLQTWNFHLPSKM